MKDINKNFLISLSASIYFFIMLEIYKKFGQTISKEFIAFTLLLLTFSLIFFMLFLYNIFQRFRFIRKVFDKRARYEGIWLLIINTSQNDKYGLAALHFDRNSDTYVYEGKSYDADFDLISNYKSLTLSFNFLHNELFYTYEAVTLKTNKYSYGLGKLSFSKDVSGRVDNVVDLFLSISGQNFNNYSCKLISISKEFYLSASKENEKELMKKLVEKYGNS